MSNVSHDPRRSSLGIDYWLHRCQGFRVESPAGRIGTVTGVRFQGSIEPELLEVRSGLLGHRLLLIPVTQVQAILPKQRRIIVQSRTQTQEDLVANAERQPRRKGKPWPDSRKRSPN
jgi:hypothetical protein